MGSGNATISGASTRAVRSNVVAAASEKPRSIQKQAPANAKPNPVAPIV